MSEQSMVPTPKDGKEYHVKNAPPAGARIMFTGCDTSQQGCSGVQYFTNTFGQTVSYTVWFNNGALGRSNWVLGPNEQHGIHVQTGDTYSMAYGSGVVPDENQRYWCTPG